MEISDKEELMEEDETKRNIIGGSNDKEVDAAPGKNIGDICDNEE